MKDYEKTVKLLTSSGKFRISPGLERMQKILKLLDNPQDKLKYIHVAGTNGKGSVCAILASILKEAGKKTGLYTSPHIFKYTERIQICSEPISENDFAKYTFEINEIANKNNIDLTEFEILTTIMFKYFADNNVEIVVLETGMGGRLDATNVIKQNMCSIITHIDYDHTERLGKTLDEIAAEKAGIIKANCPCITFEGKEAYYDRAMEVNAPLNLIVPYADTSELALKGTYQEENLALALAAIELCFPEISQNTINKGLQNTKHPCRFQYIKEKNLIIDGAHNPNGIKSLIRSLEQYYPYEKKRYIFGCLNNKDYKTMINSLFTEKDEIYFYHFSHQNSATFNELQKVCQFQATELKSKEQINFNDGKLNIICGSFYMISELAQLFDIDIF